MDLLEVEKGMEWIDLAHDRESRRVVVKAVMEFRVSTG